MTKPLSVESARLHSGHLTLERSREMRTLDIKRLGDSAEIFQDKFITFSVYYFFKLTLTEREMNFFVFYWCTSNCVAPSTPISFVRSLVCPFARSFIHSLKQACIYLFISTVGYILGWFINRTGTSFDDGKRAERTKLDFRCPIYRSAIGQASCLISARSVAIRISLLKWAQRKIAPLQVSKTLIIKTRLSAKPLLWKWVLFAWELKVVFISIASHLASLWNRGLGQLGNSLLPLPPIW